MKKDVPGLLVLIVAIAALESILVFGYGIAIVLSSFSDSSRGIQGATTAPYALLVVYLLIAFVLAVIARGLYTQNTSARTAFVLSQAFSVVIAQTLYQGSEEWERIIALGLIAMAIFSGVALLSKSVRDYFV